MLRILLLRAMLIAALALLSISPAIADPVGSKPQTIYGSYMTDVQGGPVNFVIEGHDTNYVIVGASGLAPGISVSYTLVGGVLKVVTTTDSTYKDGSDAGTVTLNIPRYEFLTVENGAGNLTINNLSTEKLAVATTGGNITVTNTNAALKAASTTGSQIYREVFGVINAVSTGGNIEVDGESGLLTLASESGALSGKGIWLQGDASFKTTTGPITMTFENGLDTFHFNLTSSSGALAVGNLTGKQSLSWGDGGVTITGTSTTGSQSYE